MFVLTGHFGSDLSHFFKYSSSEGRLWWWYIHSFSGYLSAAYSWWALRTHRIDATQFCLRRRYRISTATYVASILVPACTCPQHSPVKMILPRYWTSITSPSQGFCLLLIRDLLNFRYKDQFFFVYLTSHGVQWYILLYSFELPYFGS